MKKKCWWFLWIPLLSAVGLGILLIHKTGHMQPVPEMAPAPTDLVQSRNLYRLDLSYDPSVQTLTGQVTMKLNNPSEQVWEELCFTDWASADVFAQAPFGGRTSIQNVQMIQDGRIVSARPIRDTENPCKWVLPLEKALSPGAAIELSFDLSICIPESHGCFGYSDGVCRLGNFIPQLARWNGTEWVAHRYSDYSESAASACADFQMTLHAPDDWTVICTGENETEKGVTHAYAENVRDFAVVMGKGWKMLEHQYDGVLVRCYYRGSIIMGKEALAAACDALGAFGSAIGRYPYSTLNIVSADIWTDGMEYPQLIMIKEDYFAWSKELLHGYTHDFFRKTIAHEVAHQWFYGVVGNDQYEEPWLDESFATYLETIYANYVGMHNATAYVEMEYPLDSSLDVLQNVYMVKNTVYTGGAAFLSEIQEILGEKGFLDALKAIYQEYGYQVLHTQAALETFREVANDEQDKSIEALIETYFMSH